MRKLILGFFLLLTWQYQRAQTLACLTPTLVFSDPTLSGNPTISPTINCSYSGLLMVRTFPNANSPITAANAPCLRFMVNPTNINSATNNTICAGEGTVSSGCLNPPNNMNYTLYYYGLNPALPHSYTLCNAIVAPNMTYSVASCYDNAIITTGIWNNSSANSCQTVTIPANTPIGSASFAISPAVPPAAIFQNNGNGTIIYDPWEMAAGVYTVTYTFSTPSCTTTASRTLQIVNPFVGSGSNFTVPPAQCPNGPCINLYNQLTVGSFSPGVWSGTGVSSNSFCPSASGPGTFQITYSVGVTSVCSATNSNVFYVAPQPTANAGVTKSLTCINSPTVLNGSGGVTYSWSHSGALGNNFSTAQNPTVGLTGTYSLVVNNGTCSSSPSTVAVVNNFTQPNMPSTSVSSTINCINTQATITTSGNTAGATYTWSGPGIVGSPNQPSVVVNMGGNYTYTISHPITGCTINSVVSVPINTSVPLSITNGAAINCTNNVTTLSGNQSTYSYTWIAPASGNINSGQSTPNVTISGTGVYTVTVNNPANGCTMSYTHLPTTNTTVITPNISAANPSVITCAITSVNLNGTPGSGVTYTWATSNGNITGGTNTQNTTVGSGGIYTLSVMNNTNGCVGSSTISITTNTTPPSAVMVNTNNVILACPAQTAIITGTATGATSYSWIPPAGGSVLSGQNTATAQVTSSSPGVFTFVAIGSNGCSATNIVTVSPNTNAPTFTLSNSNPSITCLSSSPNVSVNITSTVTIQSYSWSPSSGISGPTNTNVVTFTTAGTYTAMITATNGCISSAVITVGTNTTPPEFVAGTGTAQAISCTNSVVVINPQFTPSNANLTYTWSGPGIVGSPNSSSISVNQPGTYSLTVTNTLTGCSNTTLMVGVVGNNTIPNLNILSSSTVGIGCSPGNSTVSLTAQSSSTVNYLWNTGSTSSVITTSTPGIYTVTITDAGNNCVNTGTIEVLDNTSGPGFTATPIGNLPCSGAGTMQLNATPSGSNFDYQWFGLGVVSGSNTPNATINSAGVYTVTVTDNQTGCSNSGTIAVAQATVIANFSISAVSGQAPFVPTFTNNSLGANSYTWSTNDGATSTSTNPSFDFTKAGTYTITLAASNGTCTDTYTLEITVEGALGIIPELVTPNGDGKNDLFEIKGIHLYPKNNLKIFNRWGNLVYESSPYKNEWDGSSNKALIGGGRLPVGTYYVILDFGDEKIETYKGYVQLEY